MYDILSYVFIAVFNDFIGQQAYTEYKVASCDGS